MRSATGTGSSPQALDNRDRADIVVPMAAGISRQPEFDPRRLALAGTAVPLQADRVDHPQPRCA
jgi:hypothetical protein